MTRSQGNALNTRQYTAGHGTQVTQHLNDEAGQLKHDVYRLTENPMTCAEKGGYKQVIPVIHPNEPNGDRVPVTHCHSYAPPFIRTAIPKRRGTP